MILETITQRNLGSSSNFAIDLVYDPVWFLSSPSVKWDEGGGLE